MKTKIKLAIAIIISMSSESVMAQATQATNVRTSGFYLGWDNTGTSGALDIKNDFSQPIRFYTNASASPYMTILGSTNPGFVGIGTTAPGELFEVSGGNIKLTTSSKAFMIGGNKMLWHNGTVSNLFVGVLAGGTGVTGLYNTFAGYYSGNSTIGGSENTGYGYNTLNTNQSGNYNTAVGSMGLNNNVSSSSNTALGYRALHDHLIGDQNTAVGQNALYFDSTGLQNTAVGALAQYNNKTGGGSESRR